MKMSQLVWVVTVCEVILNHVKIKNTLKEITFLKYYFKVFPCLYFIFIFPFYQPLSEGENSKLLQLKKSGDYKHSNVVVGFWMESTDEISAATELPLEC